MNSTFEYFVYCVAIYQFDIKCLKDNGKYKKIIQYDINSIVFMKESIEQTSTQ